jgi:hypothetical protein
MPNYFVAKVRPNPSSCQALDSARETMQACCRIEIAEGDVAAAVGKMEAIDGDVDRFNHFLAAAEARSQLAKIARVLVRLDHGGSVIVNANHSVM